jgi:ectoine hydroxylase-related dioxygenase (phytanoyl-CoA dioxygenase family)
MSASVFNGTPLVESPLFDKEKILLSGKDLEVAESLNKFGYALIDFPDELINDRADRIKKDLISMFNIKEWVENDWSRGNGLRLIDEWIGNDDVKEIAINKSILELLGKVYGRAAFPFQTLNFPVGTQQNIHSDCMHFNSFPERYMCGVWVALEDVDESNGPLVYYPGSHKWPILWGEHLGKNLSTHKGSGQHIFDPAWQAEIEMSGIEPVRLHCKKGQALIWAANLLHGGSKQLNPSRTRWTQVTHYYFSDCTYWRPYASNVSTGNIFSFNPPDISKNRKYSVSEHTRSKLPEDFDAQTYKGLHRDLVALSEPHAMEHWVLNGQFEGREYK